MFLAELSPTLMDSVLLYKYGCFSDPLSERMAEIMKYTDKKIRDIGVTNLGRIDIKGNYKGFKVNDVIFIPPKVSYSKEVIGVSTYGKKLTVCRIK